MPAHVDVFDPALCCSTGVCGPAPDPALPRAAADLAWLGKMGVTVARHNLATEPAAFAASEPVRRALEAGGVAVLPLVLVDGRVVATGAYPDRATLARAAGLPWPDAPARVLDVELLALDLVTCDRCCGTADALDAALVEAAGALRARGLEARVRRTVVRTVAQAEALRFVSSPTVRVDGHDLAPDVHESPCGACGAMAGTPVACRTWGDGATEHAVPPAALLVERLLEAAARPPAPAPTTPFVVPENLRRFLERPAPASPGLPVVSGGGCCGGGASGGCS